MSFARQEDRIGAHLHSQLYPRLSYQASDNVSIPVNFIIWCALRPGERPTGKVFWIIVEHASAEHSRYPIALNLSRVCYRPWFAGPFSTTSPPYHSGSPAWYVDDVVDMKTELLVSGPGSFNVFR